MRRCRQGKEPGGPSGPGRGGLGALERGQGRPRRGRRRRARARGRSGRGAPGGEPECGDGEQRFLHALNYCMLLPGPEAQQLATYIGWLMHRTWGGIVAGALFVLPSLFILVALSWVYLAFGQVGWVAGLFYGIKPAVAALKLPTCRAKTLLAWLALAYEVTALLFMLS